VGPSERGENAVRSARLVRLLQVGPSNCNREQTAVTLLKVLLIEDSPVIRKNLTEFLEELAPIRVVHSVDEQDDAICWLEDPSHECDLAIIDIFLRRGTGLAVLEAAASMSRPICLLVLSNTATADMRRRCLQLGAHAVFDKSNEIDELLAYCARLANGETGPGSLDS
jgi:DNA-binding NarL/FixJ family response regulator